MWKQIWLISSHLIHSFKWYIVRFFVGRRNNSLTFMPTHQSPTHVIPHNQLDRSTYNNKHKWENNKLSIRPIHLLAIHGSDRCSRYHNQLWIHSVLRSQHLQNAIWYESVWWNTLKWRVMMRVWSKVDYIRVTQFYFARCDNRSLNEPLNVVLSDSNIHLV